MQNTINQTNRFFELRPKYLAVYLLQFLLISATVKAIEINAEQETISDRDLNTSIRLGRQVFQSKCEKCHGVSAKGTPRAPTLVHSADRLTPQQFSDRVLNGHVIILGYSDVAGDDRTAVRQAFVELLRKRENSELVMPSWEESPVVRNHIVELYHYLKSLGDNTLPTEPSKKDPE